MNEITFQRKPYKTGGSWIITIPSFLIKNGYVNLKENITVKFILKKTTEKDLYVCTENKK